ncbi:MAG: hypothetical protein LQ340_003999 [Diploschistes diacapsis]|nr:MAG: hypothetical protein LQ340_003999 [Diploschistes diacapsis]
MRYATQCPSAGRVASQLLAFFAALSPSTAAAWTFGQELGEQARLLPIIPLQNSGDSGSRTVSPSKHEFTLQHIFDQGVYLEPNFHQSINVEPPDPHGLSRRDDTEDEEFAGPFTVQSLPSKIYRLLDRKISDIESLLSAARFYGQPPELPDSAWTLDDLAAPNATDRETVINFALMAANAYNEDKSDPEWEDSRAPFNHSAKYGWHRDTLRGHVYADKKNATVVLAIKGTSPAVFDGAETTTNDKVNDNLFFGCCCGQGGQYLWLKVCDCMSSAYTCNQTCLVKALREKNRYYHAAIELYGNVTEMYPDSNIWLTGHSLGGSVASLLGLTFGLPTITFEAPGEALPAARLGLPVPPGNSPAAHQRREYTGAYHFGHTADPVFMGSCNSATSACTLGFYAMESQCHTGYRCVWDTHFINENLYLRDTWMVGLQGRAYQYCPANHFDLHIHDRNMYGLRMVWGLHWWYNHNHGNFRNHHACHGNSTFVLKPLHDDLFMHKPWDALGLP